MRSYFAIPYKIDSLQLDYKLYLPSVERFWCWIRGVDLFPVMRRPNSRDKPLAHDAFHPVRQMMSHVCVEPWQRHRSPLILRPCIMLTICPWQAYLE